MWDDTVYDGIPMKEDDDRPLLPGGILRSSGDFSNEGSAASDEGIAFKDSE